LEGKPIDDNLSAKDALSPRSRRKKLLEESEESGTPKGAVTGLEELSKNLEAADEIRTGLRHSGTMLGADSGPKANTFHTKGEQNITTPSGVEIPKLDLGERDRGATLKTKQEDKKRTRQASDSSRGSIGRKERLKAALSERSDGSAGGADKPK
jgi:hypothetical protein